MIGFNSVGQHNNLEQKAPVKDWTDSRIFITDFVDGVEELVIDNDIINKYNQEDIQIYMYSRP